MKIKCIAVEDEPLALEQITGFIDKIPYLQLVGRFKNGLDAIFFLKSNPVDLLFLDIHLNDISGIQLLQTMNRKPYIIFTTAYDQYALKGYELDVTDYLLKPFTFERMLKAVDKVYDLLLEKTKKIKAEPEFSESAARDVIFVKADYKMKKIRLNEILYIEGCGEYLRIELISGHILSLMNYQKIMSMLPNEKFVRIHKSYIVAIDKIDCIEKSLVTIAKKSIPIGEFYKNSFFSLLEKLGKV